jgi:hypothetical protein
MSEIAPPTPAKPYSEDPSSPTAGVSFSGQELMNPSLDAEHVEKTSYEVRRAIHEIEATQTVIAEKTGLHDQELTDTVDRFLVENAEHAVSGDGPNGSDLIEVALLEGALEMTGERPQAIENPILKLENDGYDQQVTEGVQRLQEESAMLPEGESAAEVVASTLISKEARGEQPAISDELDTAIQYYVLGASKKYVQEHSDIDPKVLTEYIKDLPADKREFLKEMRRKSLDAAQTEDTVEHNLELTAPELLEGRLPNELADRIGSEYVIGLRQLESEDVGEAQEQLDDDGGVNVSNLGLVQSFNVLKPNDYSWTIKGTVISGYYGATGGGKFVIAVPMAEGINSPSEAYDTLPDMQQELLSSSNPDHRAVNPKYVAGFIDAEGVFHANKNFMRSDQADIIGRSVPAESEAPS